MKAIASTLLLLGVLRHYGYGFASTDAARFVWNISGSTVIIFFLWAYIQPETRLIAVWWTLEELQVIACSLGRMLNFWTVKPGESQCSALLGFDLGSIGLLLVSLILACQAVNSYRTKKKENQP